MNTTADPSRTPLHRRPATFAACAALAGILNASAIGIAVNASSLWPGAIASGPTQIALRPAIQLVASRDEPAKPPPPPTDSQATVRAAAPVVALPSPPPIAPVAPVAPVARAAFAAPSDAPPQPVVFYTFREVDSPAYPESDWNLDIASLDAIGVQRLAFEVLISDRGEVVGSSVLAPADLPDEVKRALEQRISATSVLPALRAGQLVASVRRVELLVAETPLDAPLDLAARRP